jgi:uncharacterized membrane protein YphA (DoxX/SURF4 family)
MATRGQVSTAAYAHILNFPVEGEKNMADMPSKWRTIAIRTLRVILGLVFLSIGTSKLTGTGHTVEYLGALISLTVLRGDPTWGGSDMVAAPLVLTLLAALLAWLTHGSHE